MWYDNIFNNLNKKEEYTTQEIYDLLVKERPNFSYNSSKWIISNMVNKGVLYRKYRGKYCFNNSEIISKKVYSPFLSKQIKEISKKIKNKFPLIDYACFESVQLNEFINHQIAKNTIFIFLEKDTIDFIFRYLQEETDFNVLLKPNDKEWDMYFTGNNIVLLNLISEAPKQIDNYHSMSIEQIFVDLIAEKAFRNLYSKNELTEIYNRANKLYLINYSKLMRYARRRNKENEIKKYIGGI